MKKPRIILDYLVDIRDQVDIIKEFLSEPQVGTPQVGTPQVGTVPFTFQLNVQVGTVPFTFQLN